MWMFPPLPSANLHFSNMSQGLSLSISLWRFAIFSSTNPCALCLQNSYVHLPSQNIKVTLQEGQNICFVRVKPSYSLCFTPFSCSCLCWCPQHWTHGGSNVLLLLIQKSSAIGFMRNKSSRSECRLWTCQKPFLSFLLFLF